MTGHTEDRVEDAGLVHLSERLASLQERNQEPLPQEPLPPSTEEEVKERFLDYLREGWPPPEAARRCGRTGTWFRRRRSPGSSHYDPEFADRYQEIMRPGGEHQQALVENARAALMEAARLGNVRAIERILMAYDPDFEFLRPAHWRGGDVYNVDKLVQIMPGIPTELLEQMIAALEQKRELPQALPEIEA